MLQLRSRILATAAVATVLFVFAWFKFPAARTVFDHDEGVILVVEFTPGRRTGNPLRPGGNITDLVSIQVGIANVPMGATRRERVSPWSLPVYPGTGQMVEVYAEQFGGEFLKCRIMYRGRTLMHDEGAGPSTVRCRNTFKP